MPANIKNQFDLLEWLKRMSVGYSLDVYGNVESFFPRPPLERPDDYLSANERGLKFFASYGIAVEFHENIMKPKEFIIKKVQRAL